MAHHTAEVLVTFTRDTFAFGISLEDMQQVYIPASVSNVVEVNEKHKMVLSENYNDAKGNTPWFAHAIIDEDALTKEVVSENDLYEWPKVVDTRSPTQRLEDDCLDYLTECGYLVSTAEIAEAVNESTQTVGRIMDTAYKRGKVYCVTVMHSDNIRASRKFWAKDYATAISHLEN